MTDLLESPEAKGKRISSASSNKTGKTSTDLWGLVTRLRAQIRGQYVAQCEKIQRLQLSEESDE